MIISDGFISNEREGTCAHWVPAFIGFCERGQILSGIAKSRIWRAFLSFCAFILFEPFLLLFGILGSTCAKWYFVPTQKWSMVAAWWQQDGGGKCSGSAAAARRR
jgi:hypothetical protein